MRVFLIFIVRNDVFMSDVVKVLLIDNDINYVNDFKKYFNNSKNILIDYYRVDDKFNISYLLEKISNYDIVFMDLIFPYIDGYTLLKELIANDCQLSIGNQILYLPLFFLPIINRV